MIVCGDRLDFSISEEIAKKLNVNIFYPEISTFPDGELRVAVHNSLVGKEVLCIKLFRPGEVHQEIIKAAFVIDALMRAGAKKIVGFVPYFPYVRSDHQKKAGEAVNLHVIAHLLEGSGLHELYTVDPHTIKFPQFFTIPVHALSAMHLFAGQIGKSIKNKSFSLVSPDSGGIRLLGPITDIFHHASIVRISKERFADGSVAVTDVEGQVEKICVIVDDIIATGVTIGEAIKVLKKKGGREFYIFATHGVFSKDTVSNLSDDSIEKIFITNTLMRENKRMNKLKILSVVDLLVSTLQKD